LLKVLRGGFLKVHTGVLLKVLRRGMLKVPNRAVAEGS
jgi:hypothetical protein